MRKRVSLSFCTAIAVALVSTSASAQMNADEIFNRLKAQAGSTGTVQAAPGSATRGLALRYDSEEVAPEAAAPSVVAVPPAASNATLAPAAAVPAAAPTPSYTMQEPAYAGTAYAPPVPAAVATVAADPIPSVTVAAPTYLPAPTSNVPTYSSAAPAPQAVVPMTVATQQTYQAVEEDKRVDLRIYFEWNSASLKPEAIGQLAELCNAIRRVGASPENKFKIIGHTDKSGSNDYNLYLSTARAREVKRHLVQECALPANALHAVGEGENQSSPATPANAPQERRVEIQFVS